MATTSVPSELPLTRIAAPRAVVRRARGGLDQVLRNPMAVAGGVVVLAWVAVAVLSPLLAPYDPIDQDVKLRLQGPSAAHLLGLVDMVLAFPSLILAMAIAAALGPSIQNSMLAMLLVWWPAYARVSRGQVLALKRRDFVTAARALGLSDVRILVRHVLPNALAPGLVLMTMDFGNAIIITAALSFLGLGAVPPTPEWGAMVAEGRELIQAWWISTFPGLAIFSVAIACNFIGDGLRDAFDPRLRMR